MITFESLQIVRRNGGWREDKGRGRAPETVGKSEIGRGGGQIPSE